MSKYQHQASCPHCSGEINYNDEHAGHPTPCPHCGMSLVLSAGTGPSNTGGHNPNRLALWWALVCGAMGVVGLFMFASLIFSHISAEMSGGYVLALLFTFGIGVSGIYGVWLYFEEYRNGPK